MNVQKEKKKRVGMDYDEVLDTCDYGDLLQDDEEEIFLLVESNQLVNVDTGLILNRSYSITSNATFTKVTDNFVLKEV